MPQGATAVEASLEFLAPTFADGFTPGSSTTSHLFVFSWNWMLLHPQVAHTDDLMIDASLRLPPGWKFGTGLTVERESEGEGNFRAIPLSTAKPAVEMNITADSPAALEASPQFTDAMRKFLEEVRALFGAEPFERYNFLFTLSDRVAHFGLEHHQSNDSRVAERAASTVALPG